MKKKLIRDPKLLPEWFPLKMYTSKLTAREWLDAIVMRLAVKTKYENTRDAADVIAHFSSLVIRRAVKPADASGLLKTSSHPGDLLGVRELSAFDAAYISNMMGSTRKGRALQSRLAKIRRKRNSNALWVEPTELIKRSQRQPWVDLVDPAKEPYQLPDVLSGVPAIIDVDQDDESLVIAFKLWLLNSRNILGPAKKPIGRREFIAWRVYRVLPYFDLTFWGDLHGLRYSETLIADVLWPHAAFNGPERLRKVTRPKMLQVFRDWSFANRFWRQLELELALAEALKGRKS
jgi:hypothetical protein